MMDIKTERDISINTLTPDETMLVLVDPINGFLKEGAMSDSGILKILPELRSLAIGCKEYGIESIVLADSHPENCIEFESYPPHCIKGSHEAELTDELEGLGLTIIEKNSTNGFFTDGFIQIINRNSTPNTYIVAGDCTDICVMQFCLALKAFYIQNNCYCRIIVPQNAVATFDAPGHEAILYNNIALNLMKNAGIEIVDKCIF